MKKLKTLKDFEEGNYTLMRKIREEAIKWVNEDEDDGEWLSPFGVIDRWKKRLNITEDDLK